MKSDFQLSITKPEDEVIIQGNRAGLEFLADVCRKVIGKTDPSGHIHISPEMGNTSPGSIPIRIEFTEADK